VSGSFRIRHACAAAILAAARLCSPGLAAAQDDLGEFWTFMSEEGRVLTVASATPESVFDSVSNVTVIDRAMIERYNFASVSEALQTVPGLAVLRTYLMHNIPTVRGALQEHYANKVLVMIDNVPMWHAVTGEGDLDRVGIDAVERIEVLLGPASVLYGSNALTGAVNIVLRKAPKGQRLGIFTGGLASGAGGYAGRGDVSRTGGLYSGGEGKYSYMVSADSRQEAQPAVLLRDENGAENSVREYFGARTFNFSGTSGASTLLLNAARSDQNYLGNTLTLASGALFNETREAALASFSHNFAPDWGSLTYTATYDWQRRNVPRDASDNIRSDIVGSRFVNSLGARVNLPAGLYLETGAAQEYRYAQRYLNYYSNTGVNQWDNSLSDRLNRESSLHAQLGLESGSWKLLAGSRYTNDGHSGDNLSSRASAIYMVDERNSLKALFSQSFRSPTPFEQYFLPSPVTVVGNPGLKPERTESYELAYLASRGNFFAHLTAYHAKYKDSIFRDLGDFTRDGVSYSNVNYYSNAPLYHAEGVELRLRYSGRHAHAFLSFDRLRGSRHDEADIPAPGAFGLPGDSSWNFKYSPHYNLSGGLAADAGRFFAASNFNVFGPGRSLRGAIPAQFWADASLGYRNGGARHTLAVKNLTDGVVEIPEYVRLRVVETLPLYTGRRLEYTFSYRF